MCDGKMSLLLMLFCMALLLDMLWVLKRNHSAT
jgi:hypothetical protein